MATVPGPRPDRPLPTPGVPAHPDHDDDDDRHAAPDHGDDTPAWAPQPYDPEREFSEPIAPVAIP